MLRIGLVMTGGGDELGNSGSAIDGGGPIEAPLVLDDSSMLPTLVAVSGECTLEERAFGVAGEPVVRVSVRAMTCPMC